MKKVRTLLLIFLIVLAQLQAPMISMPINPPTNIPGLVSTPAPMPAPAQMPTAGAMPAVIAAPLPMPIANPAPAPVAKPFTPAPVATQMPTSIPGTVPVATQFPPGTQLAGQAPARPPATAVTMTAESYKQELAKIRGDIDSINTLKTTLKAQLSDLDDQLAQTQTTLSEIKKLSFDILSKEDEKQAAQTLEAMKQSLASIQQMQKTIETTTVQEFNTTVQKIKLLMTSVQTQLQLLESKSNALKASPSAAPVAVPVVVNPVATPTPFATSSPTQPQAIPALPVLPAPPSKVEKKEISERSLIHQFFNTVADVITGSIIMVVSILKSIKEIIIPTQPTITELERQKEMEDVKKKIASSTLPPQIATPAPVITPNVAQTIIIPQAPLGSPTFANEVKTNIATIEQVVKKLDEQRFSIKQMVRDIKKQSKNLRQRIEKNSDFEKNASDKLNFDEERKADIWKKKAEYGFGTLLNWIDTTVTIIKNCLTTVYNTLHEGISKGWKAISKEQPTLEEETRK